MAANNHNNQQKTNTSVSDQLDITSSNLLLNKFEIPLTMLKTDSVLDIIQDIKYNDYIQGVYMPLHGEDGISGRSFYKATKESMWIPTQGYKKTKKEWITLIQEISKYKPVIITCPYTQNTDLIKEYIDYGISEIIINKYWNELDKIKHLIKISRSITDHHDANEPIDERFNGAMIPYHKVLDLEWLQENSKKFELTSLVNNSCLAHCPFEAYKKSRNYRLLNGMKYKQPRGPECFRYKNTTSAMIPRDIILKLSKYISRYKLIERASEPALYTNFLDYYIYNEPFSFASLKSKEVKELGGVILRMMQDKENHFRGSNMETLNCKFQCETCSRKCYSVTDWVNDYILQHF